MEAEMTLRESVRWLAPCSKWSAIGLDTATSRRHALAYKVMLEGGEDETASNDAGDGAIRIGRRVCKWDDRGFFYCTRFATVQEAEDAFRVIDNYYGEAEKED